MSLMLLMWHHECSGKGHRARFWGQAKELYEALRCPKDYVLFTAEEGAAAHCEGGAQVLFHSKVFDWLDKTLMEASPRAAVT
jgi:hypothetical protein